MKIMLSKHSAKYIAVMAKHTHKLKERSELSITRHRKVSVRKINAAQLESTNQRVALEVEVGILSWLTKNLYKTLVVI